MIDRVLIDNAIAHITEQMMKDERPAIRVIEEHLTSICTTEAIARKLLAEDKTLDGAYRSIEDEARKQPRSNGGVCIDPYTGFAIVETYYGITEDDKSDKPLASKERKVVDIMDLI